MTDTTGNFNDLVQLSGDTLYLLGEEFGIGNSLASTLTFGLSNTAGILAVLGAPTANQTLWLSGTGTLMTNMNVSAGTTSNNLTAITFSNSNGVSFGLNGSTITASVAAGGGGSVNISAGTTSNALTAWTWSNSNNVSFGLNASTLTASVSVATLSNSNNVSFGIAGSVITASYALNVSAGGGTSNALSAITFSNSNNVSFGLSTGAGVGTMTATVTVASTQGSFNLSAGTTSNLASAFTFSNSHNVSFGLNASTVTGSYALNVSAGGGTSNALSAITFSNSNNVSFGLSTGAGVGTMTGSYALNVSAGGGTSNALSGLTFANSNGYTFGLSTGAGVGTITAQYGGFSSFVQGFPGTGSGQLLASGTLYLQPFILDYCMTANEFVYLAEVSASAGTSGSMTMSVGAYTVNAGTALSLATSSSGAFSWSSASSSQFTGVQYRSVAIAWTMTPGPYVLGMAWSNANTASVTYALIPIAGQATGLGFPLIADPAGNLTKAVLAGYSTSTVAALPASIAVASTNNYVRTGSALVQPWFALQGT